MNRRAERLTACGEHFGEELRACRAHRGYGDCKNIVQQKKIVTLDKSDCKLFVFLYYIVRFMVSSNKIERLPSQTAMETTFNVILSISIKTHSETALNGLRMNVARLHFCRDRYIISRTLPNYYPATLVYTLGRR